jgi:hypothetical protein
MSNKIHVEPPYFGFLREMIRRAEQHAQGMDDRECYMNVERSTTNSLYEIEALTNIIGELECVRAECERRIRYLEATVIEDI